MATVQTFPATPQSAPLTAALMSKVSKNYRAVQALKNFDLEVRAGQLTAVLGPNGAGKTTGGYRSPRAERASGDGMASIDIADKLKLAEGTVRNYLSEAMSKLGAANRVEASRIARTKGWL